MHTTHPTRGPSMLGAFPRSRFCAAIAHSPPPFWCSHSRFRLQRSFPLCPLILDFFSPRRTTSSASTHKARAPRAALRACLTVARLQSKERRESDDFLLLHPCNRGPHTYCSIPEQFYSGLFFPLGGRRPPPLPAGDDRGRWRAKHRATQEGRTARRPRIHRKQAHSMYRGARGAKMHRS